MSSSSQETTYFNLHINGLGYLNRIRDVTPTRGDAFLACDIAALSGPSNKAEYRRFDVRVSGNDAKVLVRRCTEAVEANRKVLIGFCMGDLLPTTFVYAKGPNFGKPGVSLKARLLFISWIKIDGVMVFKSEPASSEVDNRASGSDAPFVAAQPDESQLG